LTERSQTGGTDPTLDCPDWSSLTDYYLGSIAADMRVDIDNHVAGCRRCRAQLAFVKAENTVAPPLRGRPEGSFAHWWLNPWAGIAVAAALAIVTMLGMGRELFEARGRTALPSSVSAPKHASSKSLAAIASAEPWARALATTPDGRIRWEVGIGGRIERIEGPARVQWIPSGVATDLLAVSAPSNMVCWAVGRDGVVMRTVDGGTHWEQIRPPATTDLTSIVARNGSEAAVVTADGRRYATADGGQTWHAPQRSED
jgi:hypothetical protein